MEKNKEVKKETKVKITRKDIDKDFFIYRILGIILLLIVIFLNYYSVDKINDSETESLDLNGEISIPTSERSSFIDLTKDDIKKQFADVTGKLTIYKNKGNIQINKVGNTDPFSIVTAKKSVDDLRKERLEKERLEKEKLKKEQFEKNNLEKNNLKKNLKVYEDKKIN